MACARPCLAEEPSPRGTVPRSARTGPGAERDGSREVGRGPRSAYGLGGNQTGVLVRLATELGDRPVGEGVPSDPRSTYLPEGPHGAVIILEKKLLGKVCRCLWLSND